MYVSGRTARRVNELFVILTGVLALNELQNARVVNERTNGYSAEQQRFHDNHAADLISALCPTNMLLEVCHTITKHNTTHHPYHFLGLSLSAIQQQRYFNVIIAE